MFIYIIAEAIVGIIAGLVLAIASKKSEDITYTKKDKIGRVTNIVLLLIYICLLPLCVGLGFFSFPNHDGFLRILGWIVAGIIASYPFFACLGLGLSVRFRKKGKSKLSFRVQFAGLISAIVSVGFYVIFVGNLLSYLN